MCGRWESLPTFCCVGSLPSAVPPTTKQNSSTASWLENSTSPRHFGTISLMLLRWEEIVFSRTVEAVSNWNSHLVVSVQFPKYVYDVPDNVDSVREFIFLTHFLQDLIQGMLEVIPDKRISADDVLIHPWVSVSITVMILISISSLSSTSHRCIHR
jgi:serine/threonine protein kinase